MTLTLSQFQKAAARARWAKVPAHKRVLLMTQLSALGVAARKGALRRANRAKAKLSQ
jgi:hypothetical protein